MKLAERIKLLQKTLLPESAALAVINELLAELKMASDAIEKAQDDIRLWAAYAGPHFQEKHNFRADVDACDKALDRLDEILVGNV